MVNYIIDLHYLKQHNISKIEFTKYEISYSRLILIVIDSFKENNTKTLFIYINIHNTSSFKGFFIIFHFIIKMLNTNEFVLFQKCEQYSIKYLQSYLA